MSNSVFTLPNGEAGGLHNLQNIDKLHHQMNAAEDCDRNENKVGKTCISAELNSVKTAVRFTKRVKKFRSISLPTAHWVYDLGLVAQLP